MFASRQSHKKTIDYAVLKARTIVTRDETKPDRSPLLVRHRCTISVHYHISGFRQVNTRLVVAGTGAI